MRESPESIERRRKEVTLELETKGHVFFSLLQLPESGEENPSNGWSFEHGEILLWGSWDAFEIQCNSGTGTLTQEGRFTVGL